VNAELRIVYITSWGRSGSTLIGNVLNEIPGFMHVGELRWLPENWIENRLCGSGLPIQQDEIWAKTMASILMKAYVEHDRLIRLRDHVCRTRHWALLATPAGRRLLEPDLGRYVSNIERIYQGIRDQSGCRVIVDSSKMPSYGSILDLAPSIVPYYVHLIRDPRGSAFSWLKTRPRVDTRTEEAMPRYSPLKTGILWMAFNLAAEASWGRAHGRYVRILYEDFVEDPAKALRRITAPLGIDSQGFPFLNSRRHVRMGLNHAVGGNPNRFKRGWVPLRLDEEWKLRMKQRDHALVTGLTWPLLARYGYTPLGARRRLASSSGNSNSDDGL
jgi:hypothetical protein